MADTSGIRLFSSDLDGTLIGIPESTERFAEAWGAIPAAERPILVYNSGRLVEDISGAIGEHGLPVPDYMIGGVGTEIVDNNSKTVLGEYQDILRQGWNRDEVGRIVAAVPGIQAQPDHFQTPYKSSWYLYQASKKQLASIRRGLKQAGLDVAIVYSSGRDLDVLPKRATKGNALRWLLERLRLRPGQALVAGDTGNDASMFKVRGVKGIIVENAQPELFEACVKLPVFQAPGLMADGVLQGLVHFAVVAKAPVVEPASAAAAADTELVRLFEARSLRLLDSTQQALIDTAYDRALGALRRCVTPIGFTACSMDDNESTGVDENYNSVWARDGAITVICACKVHDEQLMHCSRRTIETLIKHMTPLGQIPANVRVANGEPDYSGVGGICSLDSGLWVIIALYHYIEETGDLDFLAHCREPLERAMRWLACHDSNNDGLLEIPEASDWTDLFGRSYQVLYDEVLWYRCNTCYGRLLEKLEAFDAAAEAFHRSQYIQGKILTTFWPSTSAGDDPAFRQTFADRQYALGDVQYLLAEVTPFNYSWRCDVFGNLLAFLTHVIDIQKARSVFRFLWGVGVNQPGPVANLYPVVTSGDPDWRPYYTVNLLNLPHHYHNGGIWPLIGGMWVRFIGRLGQHDVASQELVRLAELCRRGRNDEWEFNEWFHGQTGMPMGKAYQAWSAASFVRACHELHVVDGETAC